jgi:tight adherence protein C
MIELSDILPAVAALWLDGWDVALSLGIFASVFLLTVGVFSQGGEVHVSPQREAALATGHTDRRTVFEMPAVRPFVWIFLVMAHRLNMPRVKSWVARRLVAAGSPNFYTPEEYLAMAGLLGAVVALFLELVYIMLARQFSMAMLALGMALGIAVTLMQLNSSASSRLRLISKRVPYSLDLIALAMGAGATFTEAIKTVVYEDTEDPFHLELKTVLAEMELGSTRGKALRSLSARVPLESVQSIVASVVQAEELGTPLHDVLHNEATLMRLHRSVRAEHVAAVASVRIIIPGLLILGSVVLAVFAPAILKIVRGGGLM